MKLIEAMKTVKMNKEKISALQQKIGEESAHYEHETHLYGDGTRVKVASWIKTCEDLNRDNVELLVAISRTNLATKVTVNIGEKREVNTIAYWVWRRRACAAVDQATWQKLTDRSLKEGTINMPVGAVPMQVKIVRFYDPELRDKKVAEYQAEPHQIDMALEVANAVTDLIE